MRVQGVPVRQERVAFIPFGVKVLVEAPPGAEIVIWVREDQTEEQADALIAACLTGVDLTRQSDLCLYAS